MSPGARIIRGLAVSPGLSYGPVHAIADRREQVLTWSLTEAEIEGEIARLGQAIESTSQELERRRQLVAQQAGQQDAEILGVHRMILRDPAAVDEVERTIRDQGVNAEAGILALIERLEATLGNLEGASVRSYAADIADPWQQVLDTLLRGGRQEFLAAHERVVLVARELTPQIVTSLERDRILAVITERGGRYSHGAVLARAFGVPCVAELPGLLGRLERGMLVCVDGDQGTIQLHPAEEDVAAFRDRQRKQRERQEKLAEQAALPAVTSDGVTLEVQVNIESMRDLDMFKPEHTDGLGLVRTEFLYMERPEFPSEDEQYRLYRRALERMGDRPVTLRTLDIGADKQLPYFRTPSENNPALGWRGLRITLQWQDLLRVQLRAALRAGAGRRLQILLPMVGSLEDVLLAREIFDGVRDSLVSQGYEVEADVPVGIMIEVPSVLFSLPELVDHVDFVSVGTNDLVQYLLAVDRDNPQVASLYEPRHPAVIRALERVAQIANEHGKPASVCGDVASDPAVALLLLGLGYGAVSVSPHFVAEIKYAVRLCALAAAQRLAEEVLAQSSIRGVRTVLDRFRDEIHSR